MTEAVPLTQSDVVCHDTRWILMPSLGKAAFRIDFAREGLWGQRAHWRALLLEGGARMRCAEPSGE